MPPLIGHKNSIVIKQLAIDYIQFLESTFACICISGNWLTSSVAVPSHSGLSSVRKLLIASSRGFRRLFPQFRFCLFEFPDAALPVELYSQFLIRLVTPHYIHDCLIVSALFLVHDKTPRLPLQAAHSCRKSYQSCPQIPACVCDEPPAGRYRIYR